MMLPILWEVVLLVGWTVGSPVLDNLTCPVCEPQFCPNTSECPLGTSADGCGCCPAGVCRLSVGDRCLDISNTPAMSHTDLRRYGTCGEAMVCRERTDLDPRVRGNPLFCSSSHYHYQTNKLNVLIFCVRSVQNVSNFKPLKDTEHIFNFAIPRLPYSTVLSFKHLILLGLFLLIS